MKTYKMNYSTTNFFQKLTHHVSIKARIYITKLLSVNIISPIHHDQHSRIRYREYIYKTDKYCNTILKLQHFLYQQHDSEIHHDQISRF